MNPAESNAPATRHLDIGCGGRPRNPLARDQLYAMDIHPQAPQLPAGTLAEYRCSNVVTDPIPYPDGFFHSVSAFDVVEHIPRTAFIDGRQVFPFVQVMNEIHRVLAPGGEFYAITPVYPCMEAFTDPTHVNIITVRSHEYFCGTQPAARAYGFVGRFDCTEARLLDLKLHFSQGTAIDHLRSVWRRIRGRPRTHMLWRLRKA